MFILCSRQARHIGHCGPHSKRRRHDSEQSHANRTSGLEYTDLEAAEALVCMSSWVQGHFLSDSRPNPCKPRPLTPASDSCDSLLPSETPEPPKDFVSLSSLVSNSKKSSSQLQSIRRCETFRIAADSQPAPTHPYLQIVRVLTFHAKTKDNLKAMSIDFMLVREA